MNRPTLLKKLATAKIVPVEITGAGKSLEVTIRNEDLDKFNELMVAPVGATTTNFCQWGGYRCGTGNWVMRRGYVSKGDWNDKSSAWHY